jgi:hypothetical protein
MPKNDDSNAPAAPATLEVPGIGTFRYDGIGVDHWHYTQTVDVGTSEPAQVITYVHTSQRGYAEGYAEHIRRVVLHVVPNHKHMLRDARPQVLKLMASYGLKPPDDFEVFVQALQLSHVKPYFDGSCELIFGTCPWFPNFDLNAALDPSLAIRSVWFGG